MVCSTALWSSTMIVQIMPTGLKLVPLLGSTVIHAAYRGTLVQGESADITLPSRAG